MYSSHVVAAPSSSSTGLICGIVFGVVGVLLLAGVSFAVYKRQFSVGHEGQPGYVDSIPDEDPESQSDVMP